MRSRCVAVLGAAACVAGLGLSRSSSAAEPWLEVEDSARCSVRSAQLALAIRSRVAGESNPALRVKVTLDGAPRAVRTASATQARIELLLGAESIGVKRLEAATCAEALEGVATVVALALSSEAAAAPAHGTSVGLEPPEPEHVPRARAAPLEVTTDAGLRSPRNTSEGEAGLRLWLAGAADRGTLCEPTLVVGAGVALALAAGELRSALWYAVPAVREEAAAGFERTSTDYVGGALDYCHGFAGEWLSGCTGLELGVVRRSRESEAPDGTRTEREQIVPRLAAALGLSLAYRAAPLQPALDLCAQFPLQGGLAEASPWGFRAGLSGGVRF